MEQGLPQMPFRMVSPNGLGDAWNAYPHSMAWFRDELYVGITRANLCMIKMYKSGKLDPWPVECPDNIYDLPDWQAEIWAFHPPTGRWRRAYKAPLIDGKHGRKVTRDIGYRGMEVFQAPGESRPGLYVVTWSIRMTGEPALLLTYDGHEFELLPPMLPGQPVSTYRTLFAFNGKLYTGPTGRKRDSDASSGNPCDADFPLVLACEDPARKKWVQVNEDGFGDPFNSSIYDIGAFDDHLYVATFNYREGAQLWKSRCEGKPPYRWTRVLDKGGWRGPTNEMFMSLAPFRGALYVGSGIQHGGYDTDNDIGPAGAEILRVYPDDTWELVMGERRRTPRGPVKPVSGIQSGFNRVSNGYIWRMASHEGALYAGTHNSISLLPYADLGRGGFLKKQKYHRQGLDTLMERFAGCHLWTTEDGDAWTPVTQNGFGNPYNLGIRALASTPHGLFAGCTNPFGPKVANMTVAGTRYVDNHMSGLEVWQEVPGRAKRRAAGPWREKGADWPNHDWLNAAYYGHVGFNSYGLWGSQTETQGEACLLLADTLFGLVPDPGPAILNVDANDGGFVRLILERYPAADRVTGATGSPWKIERARVNLPAASFVVTGNDGSVPLPPGTVDTVFAIQPAYYFEDRRRFLAEAARLLRPGGTLVLFDLFDASGRPDGRSGLKARDGISGIDGYSAACRDAGFSVGEARDVTASSWEPYARYRTADLRRMLAAGHVSTRRYGILMDDVARSRAAGRSVALLLARKEEGAHG